MIDNINYNYSRIPSAFVWANGSTHTITIPSLTDEKSSNTRYVFDDWNDNSKSSSREVTILNSRDYVAQFKTQYYLKIVSIYGNPKGEGWYDNGTTATFSVEDKGGILIQRIFERWSGDSPDILEKTSIIMDSPKTVIAVWKTDLTLLYLILGICISVAILGILYKKK